MNLSPVDQTFRFYVRQVTSLTELALLIGMFFRHLGKGRHIDLGGLDNAHSLTLSVQNDVIATSCWDIFSLYSIEGMGRAGRSFYAPGHQIGQSISFRPKGLGLWLRTSLGIDCKKFLPELCWCHGFSFLEYHSSLVNKLTRSVRTSSMSGKCTSSKRYW